MVLQRGNEFMQGLGFTGQFRGNRFAQMKKQVQMQVLTLNNILKQSAIPALQNSFSEHLFYRTGLGGSSSTLFLLTSVPDSENLFVVFWIFSVFLFIYELFTSGAAVIKNDSKMMNLLVVQHFI